MSKITNDPLTRSGLLSYGNSGRQMDMHLDHDTTTGL